MSNAPSPALLSAIAAAANPTSLDPTDPISASDAWDTYTLNGYAVPGVIAVDGIRGFDREYKWDLKHGKGQQGAVSTLTGQPLARGSITSWLWTPAHFEKWEEFAATVLTYFAGKTQITDAAAIIHPALQLNNVNSVVVGKIGVIRHVGKKLYSVAVEYIEWSPPPPATIVNTPMKSAPVSVAALPGDPPPAVAAAQADYFAASAAHAAAQGPN
jgi:hypothetical protein